MGRCSFAWLQLAGLLAEVDEGGALAALVEGGLGDGGDVRVALEVFAQGAAEYAHAGAVDDADAGKAGEEGLVDVALDFGLGFVGGAADDVELHGEVVGVGAGGLDVDAAAGADAAAALAAAVGAAVAAAGVEGGEEVGLCDVFAGDAHFELADGDLEVAVVGIAYVGDGGDAGLAVEALEADQVTNLEGFGAFALLFRGCGFGVVGGDGAGELLGELAAEAGHAQGGVARDLAGEGFVVDRFYGVFELGVDAGDEGVELGFELAGALALFGAAFGVEAFALHAELVLAAFEGGALFVGGGDLAVELVEEGADVCGLGGERGAGVCDDFWREARRAAMLRPAEAPGTPRRSS